MVPPCRPRALAAELGGTLATLNFGEYPFQRLSGNSERAPLRGLTSLRNRTKGHHLDASRYRKTRDPTRAASFQTVSSETVWKLRPDMMMAYALRHGDHQIPHGSVRRRMALRPPASSRTRERRTPQAARLEGDPRRRLLRAKERLPVAAFAPRVPALEDGLRLVQEVAHRRDLGALERRVARASTVPPWQGPESQRGDRGFSVGEDLGGGRKRARLRPRQECGREKAPFARRHRGFGAQGQG